MLNKMNTGCGTKKLDAAVQITVYHVLVQEAHLRWHIRTKIMESDEEDVLKMKCPPVPHPDHYFTRHGPSIIVVHDVCMLS